MTEKIASALGRYLSFGGMALAVGVPLISLVVYFAQIGPSINQTRDKQIEMSDRLNRIEDSRRDGLQRLAKVEEAQIATKDYLNQINDKLDRLIFGGNRRR